MRYAFAAVIVLLCGIALFSETPAKARAQKPCSQITVSRDGTRYRVLFAKNSAVQQFVLLAASGNTEKDHDLMMQLQQQFGPEGVNAPALRIISYKQGEGGMMIPQKAVDSCGRVTVFQ